MVVGKTYSRSWDAASLPANGVQLQSADYNTSRTLNRISMRGEQQQMWELSDGSKLLPGIAGYCLVLQGIAKYCTMIISILVSAALGVKF